MRFVWWGQYFRDSAHDAIMPIWVPDEFKTIDVRLIQCEAEILLGLDIIENSGLMVDFGKSEFQLGRREWQAMVRNGKNRWVFSLSPTAWAKAKSGAYFQKMNNRSIVGFIVEIRFR